MLIVFHRWSLISERPSSILMELIELSKMTLAFRKTLRGG
jgi:hypothetical protein